MKFKKKILKNGLRVVLSPMKDNPSVTVLVMVEAGSKYEEKKLNGLSHFLEHMCFKGTTKRPTALKITKELDSIGAHYNAFTGQEYTGYYAKANSKHLDKILDVVSDMYLDPLFPEKEIEKEKGVIIEELNMYKDMPHRYVGDVFMELMYGDQPAGWSIGGIESVIKSIKRNDFVDYRNKHYVSSATTVVVAGNFDEKSILKKIEKAFAKINTDKKHTKLKTIDKQSKPGIKIEYKETDQTHLILGVRAFDLSNKKMPILQVLDAVLGGGMSARLFQKLRDEMGVGYYVRSSIDAYTDHGYLAISTGVDNDRVKEVVKAIVGELKRFTTEDVPKEELEKAKEYLVSGMLLGIETSDSVADFCANQEVLKKEILKPEEIAKKIKAVTASQIKSLAKELFVNKSLNLAIIGKYKDTKEFEDVLSF